MHERAGPLRGSARSHTRPRGQPGVSSSAADARGTTRRRIVSLRGGADDLGSLLGLAPENVALVQVSHWLSR